MSQTITRAILTDAVHDRLGISYSQSSRLVDMIFEEIILGMIKDDVVKITSFGSFNIKRKSERVGRNPKNRKEAIIKSRKVVNFSASSQLKKKINNDG